MGRSGPSASVTYRCSFLVQAYLRTAASSRRSEHQSGMPRPGSMGYLFQAENNVVDRHIRGLRIKLQNDWPRQRFIATVPGQGYCFQPTFSASNADPARRKTRRADPRGGHPETSRSQHHTPFKSRPLRPPQRHVITSTPVKQARRQLLAEFVSLLDSVTYLMIHMRLGIVDCYNRH